MSVDPFDVAVIGAGVVGLSIARAFAATNARTVVVERHPGPGREQSTHNSGVVHSGVFARPGTLRARLNVEGNRRMYEEAASLGVPVEPCGTLVVARSPVHIAELEKYGRWGRENGVPGLSFASPEEARQIEPRLGPCERCLLAPTGGRVDAAGLVRALDTDLARRGVERRYNVELRPAERSESGWTLFGSAGESVAARHCINAAGVGAGRVATTFGAPGRRIYPCLGEYARVVGERSAWVRTMVYGFPPPRYPGIGVHLTRTAGGELLIGPTASYIDSDEPPPLPVTPLAEFAELANAYVPGITEHDLVPAPSGVRATTVPPGSAEPFGEFQIFEEPPGSGVVHCFGIESPGLTACFAIGSYVAERWPASPP
ncbi:MAG: FAD-dependent oxidoreductase [Thermoplasmata archaeon]|nr:FAD-dependent oxidoreductase [Thermoplasmata archaeon]